MIRKDTDTSHWIDIIKKAQQADDSLQEAWREDPDNVYERDGLLRIRYPDGNRIALPGRVVWKIAEQVHKLLIHFGTDKVHEARVSRTEFCENRA